MLLPRIGSHPSFVGLAAAAALVVPLTFPLAGAQAHASPSASAAARPTCGGQQATIIGTAGDDRLRGTPGRDVIVGLGGDDTIKGRGGNDLICGGNGFDLLLGGPGNDRLMGGEGADELRGHRGNDVLKGGPHVDTLLGGAGDDRLDAQQHGRKHHGWRSAQTLVGGPGDDVFELRVPNRPTRLKFPGARDTHVNLTTGRVRGAGKDRILLPRKGLWVGVTTGSGDDVIEGGRQMRQLEVTPNGGQDVVRKVSGHVTINDQSIAGRQDTDRYDLRTASSSRSTLNHGSDTLLGSPGFDEVAIWDKGTKGAIRLGGGDARVFGLEMPHSPVWMARGVYRYMPAVKGPTTIQASTGWISTAGHRVRVHGVSSYALETDSHVNFLGTDGPDIVFGFVTSLTASLGGGDDTVRDLLVDEPMRATSIDGGAGRDRVLRSEAWDENFHRKPLRGVCTQVEVGC